MSNTCIITPAAKDQTVTTAVCMLSAGGRQANFPGVETSTVEYSSTINFTVAAAFGTVTTTPAQETQATSLLSSSTSSGASDTITAAPSMTTAKSSTTSVASSGTVAAAVTSSTGTGGAGAVGANLYAGGGVLGVIGALLAL